MKVSFAIIVILLASWMVSPVLADQAADQAKDCQSRFSAFEKAHPITRFTPKKVVHGFFRTDELFGVRPEVVIGLHPNGHTYLLVDNLRYDGQMLLSKGTVNDRAILSEGMILRFQDIPEKTVQDLRSHLAAKVGHKIWSADCIHGVCDRLKEGAGIRLADGNSILPSSLFKAIFSNGFVDSSNRPIRLEVYATNDHTIDAIYEELLKRQTGRVVAGAAYIGLVISGPITIVALQAVPERK